MSPWLLAAALALAAAYAAGDAVGRRGGRRAPGTLREAARSLLRAAAALGFPASEAGAAPEAAAPDGAAPAGPRPPGAPGLADELDRYRFWLDDEWRHSEQERWRLAAVIAGLTEGIVLLDPYGRVLLANDVARTLWPRLSARLRGRYRIELFQDADCDRALSEALQTGEPRQAEAFRPGPPPRRYRLRALPIPGGLVRGLTAARGEAGAPGAAGVVVVFEDVTQQRAVEQMRRDFVANVSHELQTPLTSVRGYADTLLHAGDLDPASRARFLQHIRREAERMALLVRDLLALAQLEAPRWTETEPVDVGELAREVAAAEEAGARERGLTLSVRVPAQPAMTSGRPEELRRALANLVQNALAYTPRGGSVEVRVEQDGEEVTAAVADTGIGIPPEARSRIFERFYRVDGGRSRRTGGTGLGLAIVKHTAEGHGGRVEVESEPGRGSTFCLHLPAPHGASGAGTGAR